MHLREVLAEERAAVQRMQKRAWISGFSHIFSESLIEEMFAGKVDFHCANEDSRGVSLNRFAVFKFGLPIGAISIGGYEGGEGEVRTLYVDPDYQGQGVGRALWNHGLAALREYGFEHVNIWALKDARSCEFYEAMGCEEVGSSICAIGVKVAPVVHYRIELKQERPEKRI